MKTIAQPTPIALRRWEALADRLRHPAVELTLDEFAPILATFNQLRRAGVAFDPMLSALIDTLRRQILNSGDDSDMDDDSSGWGA